MTRSRRWARCRSRAALLTAVSAIGVSGQTLLAQMNGSWAGATDGSWSDPLNWFNGSVPGGGGTATFPLLPADLSTHNVVDDQATTTLDSIVFNSPIAYRLSLPTGVTGNTIQLSGSGVI